MQLLELWERYRWSILELVLLVGFLLVARPMVT
jgi:hypothetical protein